MSRLISGLIIFMTAFLIIHTLNIAFASEQYSTFGKFDKCTTLPDGETAICMDMEGGWGQCFDAMDTTIHFCETLKRNVIYKVTYLSDYPPDSMDFGTGLLLTKIEPTNKKTLK